MEPVILLETDDYLFINKPAGLVVHGAIATDKDEKTLVDWILKERPGMSGVGEPLNIEGAIIDRPGIVHRLDRETSGVMVLAKNQNSFDFLKEQFKARTTEKEYHAFVWGHFKEGSGIIDIPIGRSKNDFRRWHAGKGVRGEEREALTKWLVQSQFTDEKGGEFSFLQLLPKTGRTHQLRVHLKHIQRPIVSDALYAPTKPLALGFSRVALHARRLTIPSLSGHNIEVIAPYPEDFEAAIAKYLVS